MNPLQNQNNLDAHPEFKKWKRRVKRELVPMIENSAFVASIVCDPDDVDPKFAVEIGISIMLNKPIIAIMTRGQVMPEKLSRVIDKVVYYDPKKPEDAADALSEAIAKMKIKLAAEGN